MQRTGASPPIVSDAMMESLWAVDRLPTPSEQADDFVLLVGRSQAAPEEYAVIQGDVVGATIGAALSPATRNQAAWSWVLKNLQKDGLAEYDPNHNAGGLPGFRLTFKGWERFEELQRKTSESRVSFMVMKFGDPDLNRAVSECFKPAVAQTGFELRLLTDRQPDSDRLCDRARHRLGRDAMDRLAAGLSAATRSALVLALRLARLAESIRDRRSGTFEDFVRSRRRARGIGPAHDRAGSVLVGR